MALLFQRLRVQAKPPRVEIRDYYFFMTRNTEGPFGRAHAALAHPARTQILEYLRGKDYVRAGQIAEDLTIANSTLSGHLKVLRDADLLVSRHVGTEVQYRANLSTLQDLVLSLQAFLND